MGARVGITFNRYYAKMFNPNAKVFYPLNEEWGKPDFTNPKRRAREAAKVTKMLTYRKRRRERRSEEYQTQLRERLERFESLAQEVSEELDALEMEQEDFEKLAERDLVNDDS